MPLKVIFIVEGIFEANCYDLGCLGSLFFRSKVLLKLSVMTWGAFETAFWTEGAFDANCYGLVYPENNLKIVFE